MDILEGHKLKKQILYYGKNKEVGDRIDDPTISLYELLQIGKVRYQDFQEKTQDYLKELSQDIENPKLKYSEFFRRFYIDYPTGTMCFGLENEKATIIPSDDSVDHYQKLLYEKYKDIFDELARIGEKNNFYKYEKLTTISKAYQVLFSLQALGIKSDVHLLKKYIYLQYKFNQINSPFLYGCGYTAKTIEGRFGIFANIMGMKKIVEQNLVNILNNLQIYEKDLPEYLQPTLARVRTKS